MDQWWDLVRREKDGEFGPDGLGPDVSWFAENWQTVRDLRLGKPVGLPVIYDQSVGLMALVRSAVGEANLGNIDSDITPERFLLKGTGVRNIKVRVEPHLDGETSEQAAKRLTARGCVFGNTGDLAGFLHDHPEEVEKWGWVLAISEDSRWAHPGVGYVGVPCVDVRGADRYFVLVGFRSRLSSDFVPLGVLVLCE